MKLIAILAVIIVLLVLRSRRARGSEMTDEELERLRHEYQPLIRWKTVAFKWGQAYGVPYRFALGVIWTESTGLERQVGKSGEIGLMQITPAAVQDCKTILGGSDWELSFDPDMNVKVGVGYLSCLAYHYQLAQWQDVAVGYRSGPDLDPYHVWYWHKVQKVWADMFALGV